MNAKAGSDLFNRIKTRVAAEAATGGRIEALLLGLAETIKTTSNDQNVQRLARELRASAADLAAMVSSARV